MTPDEMRKLRELLERTKGFQCCSQGCRFKNGKNKSSIGVASCSCYCGADDFLDNKRVEDLLFLLDTINRIQKQNEIMKEALGKSCICGEFGYIDDDCPACVALEDCEELK